MTLDRHFRDAAVSWAMVLAACLALGLPAQAQTNIARTRHNLTSSGPGTVRTGQATGLCIFCHTEHKANPTRGLWNQKFAGVNYQPYASSTLNAAPGQPTGSSRLCLSCHDGILAPGTLLMPPKGPSVTLAPLTGATVLGTDLSKNHPVSFVYDSTLAARQGELADPLALPSTIRLDYQQQMQCTSCHDPHDDRQPKFLRMDTRGGALCTGCHRPRNWGASSHATSTATWNGSGTNPWPAGAFGTVADNSCENCHRSHSAGHAQWILALAPEPDNCTVCHNGNVAARNIQGALLKPQRHPVETFPWVHDPKENPLLMPRHVACTDCHNPHAANGTPGSAATLSPRLQGVAGVTLGGSPVAQSTHEYEICSKCHGVREPTTAGITRQSGTRNIRLKINAANPSYHPIAAVGANPGISGLEPAYSASSLITCTSCHTNDEWTATGTNPAGPHGSIYEPILGRQYSTADPSVESVQTYALCYQCHNRNFLITDQAGTFHHKSHVTTAQAPCAACHDAHGSQRNTHLIDFMLRDLSGKLVVTPSATQRRLEYISLGPGRGQCYLQCHGVNHEPKSYP